MTWVLETFCEAAWLVDEAWKKNSGSFICVI